MYERRNGGLAGCAPLLHSRHLVDLQLAGLDRVDRAERANPDATAPDEPGPGTLEVHVLALDCVRDQVAPPRLPADLDVRAAQIRDARGAVDTKIDLLRLEAAPDLELAAAREVRRHDPASDVPGAADCDVLALDIAPTTSLPDDAISFARSAPPTTVLPD